MGSVLFFSASYRLACLTQKGLYVCVFQWGKKIHEKYVEIRGGIERTGFGDASENGFFCADLLRLARRGSLSRAVGRRR